MVAGRKRKIELLHRMGLKASGGRPPGRRKVIGMVERAKAELVRAAGELEAALPAEVITRPIESLSAPEALGRASLSGLHQLARLIEEPLDPDDVKQRRLIGDMALGVNRLFMRAAEGEFRARHDDVLGKLLKSIRAEKAAEAEARPAP